LSPQPSVCVYAGSSNLAAPHFYKLAEAFGTACALRGYRLVYGGGKVGLMGAAARACRNAGGKTLGVIPTFLRTVELADEDSELIEVATMHERKYRMFDEADAFVTLPGGVGTLDEAIETLSWRRLAMHDKPLVFLAEDEFWTPLFALLEHTVEAGFTSAEVAQECIDVRSVAACFIYLDARLARSADQN